MQYHFAIVLLFIIALQWTSVQGQTDDIIETANKTGNFHTLLVALEAADLVNALKGAGPFTVFAPNDAAFAKLPPETLDDLLKPENKEKLANLLKYHVVGRRLSIADIKAMTLPAQVEPLVPTKFIVDISGTTVKVNQAAVIAADVAASNGLIYGIDTVLFIPTDIVQTATSDGSYKTLVAAITAAGLGATLQGPGPFTVFAPNDNAFSALPTGVVEDLVKVGNKPTLTKILLHHVTNQIYTTASIDRLALPVNITMASGSIARLNKNSENVQINGATVSKADVFNSNGMIHTIDKVIFPPLDLVDVAVTNGNFHNLTTALIATNLTATLRGDGPFTVFAPTDAAFAKLPPGMFDMLLQPDNLEELATILSIHVLGERKTIENIKNMPLPAQLTTLSGLKPIVDLNGGAVVINGATVTQANVESTNGLTHVVDNLILPLDDIVQTLTVVGSFNTLVQAINAAGLNETLRGDGPFTVFAPTDVAFNALPAGVVTELIKPENKDSLGKILKYHVTSQLITSASIHRTALPTTVNMLAGGSANVSQVGNEIKINDATIVTTDIYNANGMIHIVDKVLLPQLNVVETAITNGKFQTLLTALKAANLFHRLQGDGPFTVFAPTDDAFAKLPAGTVEDLLKPENKEKLIDVLQYHVVTGRKTVADIKAMTLPAQLNTWFGSKFIVDTNGDDVKINNAKVTVADIGGSNGIVHVLDTVLLPPKDIVETAINNGNFKTLVNLLISADLSNKLKNDGPFTVFAPTDAAFSALPANLLTALGKPENKKILAKILSYHVSTTLVTSPSINRKALPFNLTMLDGGVALINKDGATVKINDASVQTVDVFNGNGMIHIINKVILPPFDIFDTAFTNGNFLTLVAALRAAELDSTLQGNGPFTVFAPNDAAFAKLPNGTLDDLLKPENKGKLAKLLKYHVINNQKLTSDELDPTKELDMLDGGRVTITKNGDEIRVNGVKIIQKNVEATNGIVHVLDEVLTLPKSAALALQSSQTLFMALVSLFFYIYRSFF